MPSFASSFTQQPYPILWEQLWISQVPALSLLTCHGFITPLALRNLANMIASHGLRRRYKPRQLELTIFGAIKQHFRSTALPMAYKFLCVRFTCFVHLFMKEFKGKGSQFQSSATGATLDTGGWLNLTRQGLSPCKI